MKYTKNTILKNGKACLIRNAVREDAGAVLDLFLLTHEQTDYLSSYADEATFDVAFEENFLTEKENSENEVYLCAVVDDKIVGTAGIDVVGTSVKMRHRASLGISIHEEFWGLGIGRALMEACIACAKTAGYAQLELEVVSDNDSAVALYKSMGFAEYGRNPRGFHSRYKEWQELIAMRLELN